MLRCQLTFTKYNKIDIGRQIVKQKRKVEMIVKIKITTNQRTTMYKYDNNMKALLKVNSKLIAPAKTNCFLLYEYSMLNHGYIR